MLSLLSPVRTRSWSARTSTTTTATSPTAPSAVEAEKCLCVETTTAVGQYAFTFFIAQFTIRKQQVLLFMARTRVLSFSSAETVEQWMSNGWTTCFIGSWVSQVLWRRCKFKVYFILNILLIAANNTPDDGVMLQWLKYLLKTKWHWDSVNVFS